MLLDENFIHTGKYGSILTSCHSVGAAKKEVKSPAQPNKPSAAEKPAAVTTASKPTTDKPAQVKPNAGNKPPTGGKPPAKKPLVNKRHIETDSDSSDQV
jgi:hypothetical protein